MTSILGFAYETGRMTQKQAVQKVRRRVRGRKTVRLCTPTAVLGCRFEGNIRIMRVFDVVKGKELTTVSVGIA